MAKTVLMLFLTILLHELTAFGLNADSCKGSYKESLDLKMKLKKNGPSTWVPSFTAKKYVNNTAEELEIDLEHTVQKCGEHDLHRLKASVREDNSTNDTNAVDSKDIFDEGYLCRRRVGYGKSGSKVHMKKNGTYTTVMTLHPLKINEMFEASLDWDNGLWYFAVGLTNQSTSDILNPHWLDYDRPGTWTWYAIAPYREIADVYNGDQATFYFMRKQKFGLMIKEGGNLHFYVEDVDDGPRICNLTQPVHAFIELLHYTGGISIE